MLKKIYDCYSVTDVLLKFNKKTNALETYTLEEALRLIPKGAKIKFDCEKKRYTVRARNERYIIMSKPFNLHDYKFAYSIIDIDNMEMSRSDIIFDNTNYLDEKECEEAIQDLESGDKELSRRAVASCYDKIKEIWVDAHPVKGEGECLTKEE